MCHTLLLYIMGHYGNTIFKIRTRLNSRPILHITQVMTSGAMDSGDVWKGAGSLVPIMEQRNHLYLHTYYAEYTEHRTLARIVVAAVSEGLQYCNQNHPLGMDMSVLSVMTLLVLTKHGNVLELVHVLPGRWC